MTVLLKAEGLTKQFGYRPVLNKLNLTVAAGEVVALFGPNGAGKSTLLRLVTGLSSRFGGQLALFGETVTHVSPALRQRLALLGHQSFCYEALSGHENLTFYARLHGLVQPEQLALHWLNRVGLTLFAHEPVATYSRGMQQRLALARCLLTEPDLICLDEPGTGLDLQGADLLQAEVRAARERGAGVLLVTHEVALGLDLADRAVLMSGGRIVLERAVAGLDPDEWAAACRLAAQGARAG